MRRWFCLLLLLLASLPALACPFCNPGEADMFSELVDSEAVVLVQRVETRKYKILEVLKGNATVGKTVIAAEPNGKARPNTKLLLTTAGSPNLPYWSDAPRYVDTAEIAFARKALLVGEGGDTKRWDFAAAHLENDSTLIAESAYNVLAAAPLSAVQARVEQVGVNRLRQWCRNSNVPAERRALYLLMAYPRLSGADAGWVNEQLFSSDLSPNSPTVGPLVITFLHLKGASGLPKVRARFLEPALPASRTLAVIRALTLLGHNSSDSSLRSAIQETFLQELAHPQRGGFVIAPLAVWGQYEEAAPGVQALVDKNPHVTWLKVAAIRYFRSFQGPKAEAVLARWSKDDPELVKRTTDPYSKDDLSIE